MFTSKNRCLLKTNFVYLLRSARIVSVFPAIGSCKADHFETKNLIDGAYVFCQSLFHSILIRHDSSRDMDLPLAGPEEWGLIDSAA